MLLAVYQCTVQCNSVPVYQCSSAPVYHVPPKAYRVAAMACPPLFYIMAAEKEKIKPLFKAFSGRSCCRSGSN